MSKPRVLRGYAPEMDHASLTREFSGRRISTADPESSTLLRKIAGQAPHEGGKLVQKGEFITCSSAAVPKAVLRRMGGFPQQRLGEDGELWARIAVFYPLAYDVRVLATYHSEA